MSKRNPDNPFESSEMVWGHYPQAVDAESRMSMIKSFDADQLRKVLALPGVQKSARLAAERRLKKLEQAR